MLRLHSVPSEYDNDNDNKSHITYPSHQNNDSISSHNSSFSQIPNNGGNSRSTPLFLNFFKNENNSSHNSSFSQTQNNGGNSRQNPMIPPTQNNEPNTQIQNNEPNTAQFNNLINNQSIFPLNNDENENIHINQEININNNINYQINPENNNTNNTNKKPIFGIIKEKRTNQTIGNRTTRYKTNTENGNIQIEKVEEKAKKTDENDEEEKYSNTDLRNTWKSYFIHFFANLLELINILIEERFPKNPEKIIPYISKEYLYKYKYKKQYDMLDEKAINVLTIDINNDKIKNQEDAKLYNQRLLSIYEEDQKKITSVLNKTIGDLMAIYLEKEVPKEEYYTNFKRFKEYCNNLKNDNKKKMEKVGKEFKEKLNKVLFDNSDKRGRKPEL